MVLHAMFQSIRTMFIGSFTECFHFPILMHFLLCETHVSVMFWLLTVCPSCFDCWLVSIMFWLLTVCPSCFDCWLCVHHVLIVGLCLSCFDCWLRVRLVLIVGCHTSPGLCLVFRSISSVDFFTFRQNSGDAPCSMEFTVVTLSWTHADGLWLFVVPVTC